MGRPAAQLEAVRHDAIKRGHGRTGDVGTDRLSGLAPVQVERPNGLQPGFQLGAASGSERGPYGPVGSWDLFRPNGSRLGTLQPGLPEAIILGPARKI
jgi:hypothetical protein